MVTWDNYEEYVLLYTDGELGEAEVKALMDFADQHPEVKKELKDYERVRLMPEVALVYKEKETLLKQANDGKVIRLGSWWMYGAAAGILILIGVMLPKWMNNNVSRNGDNSQVQVAKHEGNASTVADRALETADITPAAGEKEVAEMRKPSGQRAIAGKKAPVDEVVVLKKESIKSILPSSYNTDREAIIPRLRGAAVVSKGGVVMADMVEANNGFLAWLPVTEEKKEGLRGLRENVETRVEKVKEMKDSLKDMEIAVKLGDKELFVITF